MRVNFIIGILLLIIAIVLYALPRSILEDFRLTVFDLYSRVDGSVRTNIPSLSKGSNELTSSVPLEVQHKELLDTLEKKDAEIAFLKKEVRQLIEFKDEFPKVELVYARIISESSGDVSPELIIDKGYLDGVVEGAAVVQGAVIAGVVVRVERNSAIVLRADNDGVLIPARSGKSRDRCSVKGAGYERATAVFYTAQTAAMVGERVFTSSALGSIPQGLLVGVLEDYPQKGEEPGTLEAPVKLDADFISLERVVVVREF